MHYDILHVAPDPYAEYCPQCNAVSMFKRHYLQPPPRIGHRFQNSSDCLTCAIFANICLCCGYLTFDYVKQGTSVYYQTRTRIYPTAWPHDIPMPNPDMPESIKNIYTEAAQIFEHSPRAAAILLRLCLQELLKSCGFKGSVHKMIEQAKINNIDLDIRTMMDACRTLGNKSAHEAQQLVDKIEDMRLIFKALNIITTATHTYQREKSELTTALSKHSEITA